MRPIFQKNLQFPDICSRNLQKIAQIEVFGHFLDFTSLLFLNFTYNDMWAWCLVVFSQFADPVNVFLFFCFFFNYTPVCWYCSSPYFCMIFWKYFFILFVCKKERLNINLKTEPQNKFLIKRVTMWSEEYEN